MAGEDLPAAVVEPWGIAGDRRWMVVDETGRFRTAREFPRLLSIVPTLSDVGVRLHGGGGWGVEARPGSATVEVEVWRSRVVATLAEPAAHEWLSAVLGIPCRLVFLDDPTRREVNPDYGQPGDRVSFADGYPLLLANETSLRELNGWIAEGNHADEGPLPIERFRPNVVVAGFEGWAEDDWSRLQIGEVVFRVAKPCGRCVVTTTDPSTGERGREPLVSLAKHRNRDGSLLFGVNVIPEGAGSIAVGDEVVIL